MLTPINFISRFVSLFFEQIQKCIPLACLLCGHKADVCNLCSACLKTLPILSNHCRQCASFLPFDAPKGILCGQCVKNPPLYERIYAAFPYETPLSHFITRLKFQRRLEYAQSLGELLIKKIKNEWYKETPLPTLILPVPLHVARLKERGFNQALEIARPIAKAFKIPLDDSLVRIKNTQRQSHLSASQRLHNLRDAFIATQNYQHHRVAIVDDVITTGQTIKEVCKILRHHGAQQIQVWCCARRG